MDYCDYAHLVWGNLVDDAVGSYKKFTDCRILKLGDYLTAFG